MLAQRLKVDTIGLIGLFITAILSPCCFPLWGVGLSALGFGSFELFGSWTMIVFQILTIISLIGIFIAYLKHKRISALVIGMVSTALIFVSYYYIDADYWIYLTYAGMIGMLIASILNYRNNKAMKTQKVQLQSTITCPHCNHSKIETMPTNACAYFYECENCSTRLKAKEGDCCVYCSYGTVQCPPMQVGQGCC